MQCWKDNDDAIDADMAGSLGLTLIKGTEYEMITDGQSKANGTNQR